MPIIKKITLFKLILLINKILTISRDDIDMDMDNILENSTETKNYEACNETILYEEIENNVERIVNTDYGTVKGLKTESGIWQYFDIPYGAINEDNPFQEPMPPKTWSGVQILKEHKSLCPQLDHTESLIGTMECLTLSIFTPSETINSSVLFHIHDGSFVSGSGDHRFYGPEHLVPKGVILVLPNYRLGVLGFLCLQNDTIPGNAGLKDLMLALNWTRNNIEAFGGNSSNIVVSGSGSAAALVEYLLISQKSKQFISKAITESGFALSDWAIDRQPLQTAALFEMNLKKIEQWLTLSSLLNQFNTSLIEQLLKASKGIILRPCIENDINGFLTNTPWSTMKTANINIDYMIGTANFAGMNKIKLHTKDDISEINNDYTLLLPNDLQFKNKKSKEEIAKRVKMQYFGEDDIAIDNIHNLTLCYTDSSYLSPAIRGARSLLSAGATIYFYEFSFGKRGVASEGESMNYVFKRNNILKKDLYGYKMKEFMTSLWISFIKTGQPKSGNIEWKTLEALKDDEEKWLNISSIVKLEKGLHLERLRLWEEIYDNFFIDNNNGNKIIPLPSIFTILIASIIINKITLI